ncbi:MAG: TrkA family potassium uptake protein [Methanosarcinaceae archaeon]|nr:TrkA family potassium uptake protein [Methanosarcinaceae archaeon]MDF1534686.1 TrkA family potassium uptake protein [Methanosarcinaceae archaeon]
MIKNGHLIVLGYGDVGKQIVEVLQDNDVRFVVVDLNKNALESVNFEYVIGNGADEDVLKEAGVESASTVIVTLNDDTNVIFATLITRSLNPKSTILARANSVTSIEKIYKAGADYVASLSIVAGQMLAKMTATCMNRVCEDIDEDIMLYEGIEIEKHHVHKGSDLIGKSVAKLDIRHTVGCTIIGIERDNKVITDIVPSMVINEEDIVAVVGSRDQVSAFKKHYIE